MMMMMMMIVMMVVINHSCYFNTKDKDHWSFLYCHVLGKANEQFVKCSNLVQNFPVISIIIRNRDMVTSGFFLCSFVFLLCFSLFNLTLFGAIYFVHALSSSQILHTSVVTQLQSLFLRQTQKTNIRSNQAIGQNDKT